MPTETTLLLTEAIVTWAAFKILSLCLEIVDPSKFNSHTMPSSFTPIKTLKITSGFMLTFSDTLGHLLTNAQNKLRCSTDAHRHSSKLWGLDAEMLSVFPGKEPGCATQAAGSARCLGKGSLQKKKKLKAKHTKYYRFSPFFCKSENPPDFLQLWKHGLIQYRSFLKAKWPKLNFWKVGDTRILTWKIVRNKNELLCTDLLCS